MIVKAILRSLLFILIMLLPLQAKSLEEMTRYVGITHDLHYNAMNVIKNFGEGFFKGELNTVGTRGDEGYFASYITLGKLIGYNKWMPPVEENLVQTTPSNAFELNEIFKSFLLLSFIKNAHLNIIPKTDFNSLTDYDLHHAMFSKYSLDRHIVEILSWEEAKYLKKHIVGAAFLARLADTLAMAGYGPGAHIFDHPEIQNIGLKVRKSLAQYSKLQNIDDYINQNPLQSFLNRGFDPLTILATVKNAMNNKINTHVHGEHLPLPIPLDSRIQKINDNCYVMQQSQTLYFVMEKITPETINTWDEVHKTQRKWGQRVHYTSDNEIAKNYPDRGGKTFHQISAGTTAIASTLQVFKDNQNIQGHTKQDLDFWVCYAFSTNGIKKPTYPFNIKDIANLEMDFTVMTSRDTPFTSHMGIARNVQHIINRDIPYHSRISMLMHAFAAKVMRHRDPRKTYMINAPVGEMATQLKRTFTPKDITILLDFHGLNLFNKDGHTIFSRTKKELENIWFGQHWHILSGIEGIYIINLEAIANLL